MGYQTHWVRQTAASAISGFVVGASVEEMGGRYDLLDHAACGTGPVKLDRVVVAFRQALPLKVLHDQAVLPGCKQHGTSPAMRFRRGLPAGPPVVYDRLSVYDQAATIVGPDFIATSS